MQNLGYVDIGGFWTRKVSLPPAVCILSGMGQVWSTEGFLKNLKQYLCIWKLLLKNWNVCNSGPRFRDSGMYMLSWGWEWLSLWTQCVPPLPLPDSALPGINPLVTRS